MSQVTAPLELAGRPAWPARASDEALAIRVARGDDHAFTVLYERYRAPLYRYLVSLLREPEDARDVLQTTMMNAFRSLRAGPRDLAVKPWLFRIAHNAAVSFARRRRAHAPITEELQDDQLGVDGIAARQRVRQVLGDLEDLPDRRRRLLLMREVQGLDYDEIALVFAISPAAARQAVHEVRAALAEAERGRELECGEVTRIAQGDRRRARSRALHAHLTACATCRTALASGSGSGRALAVVPAALAAVKSSIAEAFGLPGLGGALSSAAGGLAGKGLAAGIALLTAGSLIVGTSASGGGASGRPASASPPALGSTLQRFDEANAAAVHGELSVSPPPSAEPKSPSPSATAPEASSAQGNVPPSGPALGGSPAAAAAGEPGAGEAGGPPYTGHGPAASAPPAAASPPSSDSSGEREAAPDPAAPAGGGGSSPGASGSAPGQGGTPPGQGGTPPGQSGSAQGNSDSAPGQGGTPPGQGGTPPGQTGSAGSSSGAPGQGNSQPGSSGSAPGQSGVPQGDTPPGQAGSPPGQSGSAAGTGNGGSALASPGSGGQPGGAPGQSGQGNSQSGGAPGGGAARDGG